MWLKHWIKESIQRNSVKVEGPKESVDQSHLKIFPQLFLFFLINLEADVIVSIKSIASTIFMNTDICMLEQLRFFMSFTG